MHRRSYLASGVAGLAALAGCSSERAGLREHSAAANLADQPVLGPDPGTGSGTIIAFEDPSCPSCRRFESDVFPKIAERLVRSDPGVSFVFRNIPVVRQWAGYASLAMETVYRQAPAEFWRLKSFYYWNQPDISSDNVADATRQFLEDTDALDADSVLAEIRAETHQPAVQADLDASRDADVRGTPTFFLFDGGSYVTELTGAQSYEVFAESLSAGDG